MTPERASFQGEIPLIFLIILTTDNTFTVPSFVYREGKKGGLRMGLRQFLLKFSVCTYI